MNDPKRLLEAGSELEMAVLDSARDDVAPKRLDALVRAALGLGVVVGAGTVAAAAAAATTGAATRGASLLGWTASSVGVSKWVGLAVIGSAAIVGGATLARNRGFEPPAERATVTPSRVAKEVAPASRAPSTNAISVSTPTAAATSTSTSTPTSTPTPTSTSTSMAAAPPPSDLATELVHLDAARAALDTNDSLLAIQHLDRHDLDYPHGRLAPESLALRIEAYAQRRDEPKVRALAAAFLSRYPTHPQARRVRSIADSIADEMGTRTNP